MTKIISIKMQPKQTKYRKFYKPRQLPKALSQSQKLQPCSSLTLMALESAYLTGKQVEAARKNIRRRVKRRGILNIHVFTDIAISRKSSSARMGKGKGKVNHWVGAISAGQSIMTLTGISFKEGLVALRGGAHKLPLKLHICEQ